jgi:hypothetical protein
VALLVEACLAVAPSTLPDVGSQHMISRKAIRGQNLDRAGLGAQHQKLLSQINEPISLNDLTRALHWDEDEARRVLFALQLADLIEVKGAQTGRKVVVVEPDPHVTLQLRRIAESPSCPVTLKVVRDRLSLQLICKRQQPDVIVIALDNDLGQQIAKEMMSSSTQLVLVGVVSDDEQAEPFVDRLDGLLGRPFDAEQLFQAVETACSRREGSACTAV